MPDDPSAYMQFSNKAGEFHNDNCPEGEVEVFVVDSSGGFNDKKFRQRLSKECVIKHMMHMRRAPTKLEAGGCLPYSVCYDPQNDILMIMEHDNDLKPMVIDELFSLRYVELIGNPHRKILEAVLDSNIVELERYDSNDFDFNQLLADLPIKCTAPVNFSGTLLHFAVYCESTDVVKWLLSKGVDVDKPAVITGEGFSAEQTPLQLAETIENNEIMALLKPSVGLENKGL